MNITIVGGQSDRLEILSHLIDEGDDWNVSVITESESDTAEFQRIIDRANIVLVDLAYVSTPSPEYINQFKDQFPDKLMIGLHFYKNRKLVYPLLEAGLDGYIYSNSPKKVLINAIEDVSSGKTFILERE